MSKVHIWLCAISIVVMQPFNTGATGFIDADDGMLDMGDYLSDNRYGFLPVPMVITEPAVGYGAGLFGLFYMIPPPIVLHLKDILFPQP